MSRNGYSVLQNESDELPVKTRVGNIESDGGGVSEQQQHGQTSDPRRNSSLEIEQFFVADNDDEVTRAVNSQGPTSPELAFNILSSRTPETFSDVLRMAAKSPAVVVANFGIFLILFSVLYPLILQPWSLFSFHPLFVSFGLLALSQATIIVQPITPDSRPLVKSSAGGAHGLLNSLATLFFALGAIAIVLNKLIHRKHHFTTVHSFVGLFTLMLILMNAVLGVSMFWMPQRIFGSFVRGKSYYKYHRILGYTTIVMILSSYVAIGFASYGTRGNVYMFPLLIGIFIYQISNLFLVKPFKMNIFH